MKNRFYSFSFVAMLCLASGFLALQVVNQIHPPSASLPTSSLEQAKDIEAMYSAVVVDSVLALLKSYYVDPDRVDNHFILQTAINRLKERTQISVRQSGKEVEIKSGDRSYKLQLPKKMTYNSLLSEFTQLAEIARRLNPADEPKNSRVDAVNLLLNSVLTSLDPYSVLLTPEMYKELKEGTEGTFGGLGVLVGIRDNLLTVIKALPRSPASRIGIVSTDKIVAINGMSTFGSSLEDLVGYMRGAPGTSVKLSLMKDGAIAAQEIHLKREVIQVDSVTHEKLPMAHGSVILHLTIETFSMRTLAEIKTILAQFNPSQVRGVILDLRSNPGGLLDQAVRVADLFLNSGKIVTTRGRHEEVDEATDTSDDVTLPMAVVVNEDSASASEIVAGALQDQHRAVIIGRPSYGKGSVQTVFEIPGGNALKLTIARYYTPSGRSIQNVGIVPDIWVQPVAQKPTNENLLGEFRYRRIIKGEDEGKIGLEKLAAKKWYYPLSDGKKLLTGREDYEIKAAAAIVDALAKTPNPRLIDVDDFVNRQDVRNIFENVDDETSLQLNKRFAVDWKAAPCPFQTSMSLKVLGLDKQTTIVSPGDRLSIRFNLRNSGSKNCGRVSLFAWSKAMGGALKERLVGFVPRGAVTEGRFDYVVPAFMNAGKFDLNFGLAQDGVPVRTIPAEFNVLIKARHNPALKAVVTLTGEIGGAVAGQLEAGERATLLVNITNRGDVDAHVEKIDVVNLAGRQVTLGKPSKQVMTLKPGQSAAVSVEVKGSPVLISPNLDFGIYVESKDLAYPYRDTLAVHGVPSKTAGVAQPNPHIPSDSL